MGLVVDVKRNGVLVARMDQLGTAWGLEVIDPQWTEYCDSVIEAYEQYARTCRLAGKPADSDDVLTVIEITRTVRGHGRLGVSRPGREPVAHIVQLQSGAWELNLFRPQRNAVCKTVSRALEEFLIYAEPQPQRGPVGGH
jgi:hypothetical protein